MLCGWGLSIVGLHLSSRCMTTELSTRFFLIFLFYVRLLPYILKAFFCNCCMHISVIHTVIHYPIDKQLSKGTEIYLSLPSMCSSVIHQPQRIVIGKCALISFFAYKNWQKINWNAIKWQLFCFLYILLSQINHAMSGNCYFFLWISELSRKSRLSSPASDIWPELAAITLPLFPVSAMFCRDRKKGQSADHR